MTLTVPKAGVIAGAAASPRFEAPQTGAAIAKFGDVMAQVGIRIQQEREQRGLQQARLDGMRGLNDLQTEFDQIGDPDRIDAEYGERVRALRDSTVGRLSPEMQERAGLAFDEMALPHETRQGRRAIDLRHSAEMATLSQAGDEMVRAGALGDPETQETYRRQYAELLDSAVARGVMDPAQAHRLQATYGAQMENARASRMMSEDPDALVGAIDAGEFTQIGGDAQQGLRARAVANQSRARAEQMSQVSSVFRDGTAVLRTGQPYARADELLDLLADPEIAALPEAQEYASAVLLNEALPGIAVMTPAAKREKLAELKATPMEKPYQAEITGQLEKMIEADEKALRDDPLSHSQTIGIGTVPALPDPSDPRPESMVPALEERAHYAQSLVTTGHVPAEGVKFFTAEERERWSEQASPAASPQTRAALAGSIASGLSHAAKDQDHAGAMIDAATAELGADPVFAYVGTGLAYGMNTQTARHIFEGQRAIENKDVPMPPVAARRGAVFAEIDSLFSDGTVVGWPDQTPQRDQIIGATDALYAYRQRGKVVAGNDVDAQIDQDAYVQAMNDVMGGALKQVRGELTILPPGIEATDVGRQLDVLQTMAVTEREKQVAAQVGMLTAEQALGRISVTGSLPDLGGELPDENTMRNLSIRAVGQDQYIFVRRHGGTGELTPVFGNDGALFTFDIHEFMKLRVYQK